MQAHRIDERLVADERLGSAYVVFVYTGGGASTTSWSVDSHLLTDTSLVEVLGWLGQVLPVGSCWSLGVVEDPATPDAGSACTLRWLVGDDVLNIDRRHRSPEQQRIAEEMLTRRDRTTLP